MDMTDVPAVPKAGRTNLYAHTERDRLVHVSRRYYELGQTQESIARALGVTRPHVSKLLKQARASGVVEIRVIDDRDPADALGRDLTARFGLQSVHLAPSLSSDDLTRRRVGQLAAEALAAALRAGLTVGVGDGASMSAVADAMDPSPHAIDATVVPLCGGYWGGGTSREPFRRIAEVVGASARGLMAPGLLDDRVTRDALLAHAGIRAIVELWDRLDVAMFGIGSRSWSEGSVGAAALAELEAHGAIGEVLMAPFDRGGEFLTTSLSGRTIAIPAPRLRDVPSSIAVASGASKVVPILGALRSGIVGTLVTDVETATAVLRAANEEPDARTDSGSNR